MIRSELRRSNLSRRFMFQNSCTCTAMKLAVMWRILHSYVLRSREISYRLHSAFLSFYALPLSNSLFIFKIFYFHIFRLTLIPPYTARPSVVVGALPFAFVFSVLEVLFVILTKLNKITILNRCMIASNVSVKNIVYWYFFFQRVSCLLPKNVMIHQEINLSMYLVLFNRFATLPVCV